MSIFDNFGEAESATLADRNRKAIEKASPLLDKISESWASIEQFFLKNGILCRTSIAVGKIYDDSPGMKEVGEYYLGIVKVKGKWRICHGDMEHRNAHMGIDWTPISDSPNSIRIEMLDKVDELFTQLVKSNEDQLTRIQTAAIKSQSILANLEIANL